MVAYLQSLLRLPRAVHFYLLSEMFFGLASGLAIIMNFHYLALHFSTEVIGFASAIYSVIVAALSYPAGIVTDRFGAKKSMLIGAGTLALGYFCIAWATTPWTLYLAQMVIGAGTSFVISCEFPYIMSLCERREDETTAFNLLIAAFMMMVSVGNILGTKLPPYMPRGNTNYQSTIFLVSFFLFLMFLMRCFLPAKSKRLAEAEQQQKKKSSWKVIPSKQVVLFVLYATISGLPFFFVTPFENVILRARFALSDDTVGYLIAVNSFMIFLTTLFSPLLMQTKQRRAFLYTAYALQLLIHFTMATRVPVLLFAVLMIGKGSANNLIGAFVDSSMMKATSEEERGLHAGMRNLTRSIAGSLAASFSGFVMAGGDYQSVYLAVGLAVVLQIVLFLFVRRQLIQDLGEPF